jgi:transcription initiation factor TFIIIB Brf1 subunit/transcription initiation factor TFIIB
MIRSKVLCPMCNTEDEIWQNEYGIFPKTSLVCNGCGVIYESNEFVYSIMELRDNSSATSNRFNFELA